MVVYCDGVDVNVTEGDIVWMLTWSIGGPNFL